MINNHDNNRNKSIYLKNNKQFILLNNSLN